MGNSNKAIWDCLVKFSGTKQRLIEVMEDRDFKTFEEAEEHMALEAEFIMECAKDRMMESVEEESDEQPADFFCEQEEVDGITENEHEWRNK
jgi:hypothetical protein